MHLYREEFETAALELESNLGDALTADIKQSIANIKAKTFTNFDFQNFTKEAEKCWSLNSRLLKGLMCSMCSPESALRIGPGEIKFDRKEAAEFSLNCSEYLQQFVKLSSFLQDVYEVTRITKDGKKKGVRRLDFTNFLKSDYAYLTDTMRETFAQCHKANDELLLLSVDPSKGCYIIAEKFMGIGPLTKFDEVVYNDMVSLNVSLRKDYNNRKKAIDKTILDSSEKRILSGGAGASAVFIP